MNTDFYQIGSQSDRNPCIFEKMVGIDVIGALGVGVAIVDPEGRIITANPVLLAMLGYSEPEILNLEFLQLVESDNLALDTRVFQKNGILDKGERFQADQRLLRKDGRSFWARLTISRGRQEDLSVDSFVVTVEDITQWKQAEEALIGEKKRLVITLGSIGDGVITTDTDGKIVLMNQAAEEITGWPRNEAAGAPFGRVFAVRDRKTGAISTDLATVVLKTGTEIAADDLVIVGRQGRERLVSFRVAPIQNPPGDDLGVVLIFRDTTHKRKKEVELFKSQKLESIGVLAGGIAHDFNNVLAGILANVQLAKLTYEKGKDLHKILAGTENAVKRAAELTKQLFSFSKGESPVKEVISIAQIIQETVAVSLQDSKVNCEYSLPDNLWPIEADPRQLSQLIDHLITNADQAMPQGGVIQVSVRNMPIQGEELPPLKPGAYLQIAIRDGGVGIPEANLGKIFDPFFTTKERRSGLGLSNAYAIVKRHDGYINVTSIEGMGTTFEIYLPATLGHSVAREKRMEYQAVSG